MGNLKKDYERKNTFLRNWGATIILLAFFLISWGGHLAAQLQVEQLESQQHGLPFDMQKFWPQFWSSTLENWQSEWLQLTAQAVLVSGLAAYIFRKQGEEHYKTQIMIEELREEIKNKR